MCEQIPKEQRQQHNTLLFGSHPRCKHLKLLPSTLPRLSKPLIKLSPIRANPRPLAPGPPRNSSTKSASGHYARRPGTLRCCDVCSWACPQCFRAKHKKQHDNQIRFLVGYTRWPGSRTPTYTECKQANCAHACPACLMGCPADYRMGIYQNGRRVQYTSGVDPTMTLEE